MYLLMRLHFKIIFFLFFATKGMSTGLQFLTIRSSAKDLIFFQTPLLNPAFLNTFNRSPEMSFAYGKWFADSENISLNWSGQVRSTSAGLIMRYIGINDIELRGDVPSSQPLGYYGAYGVSAKTLASFQSSKFRYGVALQVISIQLYQESSTGIAGDFGMSWLINESLTLSGSLLNFGKMNILYEQKPTLPQRAIGLINYKRTKSDLFASIEFNELIKNPIFFFGSTARKDNLSLGATLMMNDATYSLSTGAGFSVGRYTFSYALQYGNQEIGVPQMFDISLRLP